MIHDRGPVIHPWRSNAHGELQWRFSALLDYGLNGPYYLSQVCQTRRLADLRPYCGGGCFDDVLFCFCFSRCLLKIFWRCRHCLVGGSTKEARRNLIYAVMTKFLKQIDFKNVFGWTPGAIIYPRFPCEFSCQHSWWSWWQNLDEACCLTVPYSHITAFIWPFSRGMVIWMWVVGALRTPGACIGLHDGFKWAVIGSVKRVAWLLTSGKQGSVYHEKWGFLGMG